MIMEEDEIRKNMEHDYIEELLIQEEERLEEEDRQEQEQEAFDEEALRLTLEEKARWKEQELKREQDEQREHEDWEKMMGLHPSSYISDEELKKGYVPPSNIHSDEESYEQEPYNRVVVSVNQQIETQESFAGNMDADEDMLIAEVVDAPCDPNQAEANKGKVVAIPEPKKKGKKRQAHDDPLRIYPKIEEDQRGYLGKK